MTTYRPEVLQLGRVLDPLLEQIVHQAHVEVPSVRRLLELNRNPRGQLHEHRDSSIAIDDSSKLLQRLLGHEYWDVLRETIDCDVALHARAGDAELHLAVGTLLLAVTEAVDRLVVQVHLLQPRVAVLLQVLAGYDVERALAAHGVRAS